MTKSQLKQLIKSVLNENKTKNDSGDWKLLGRGKPTESEVSNMKGRWTIKFGNTTEKIKTKPPMSPERIMESPISYKEFFIEHCGHCGETDEEVGYCDACDRTKDKCICPKQRCAKCNELKPAPVTAGTHGYIAGWICKDCRNKEKLSTNESKT